MRMKYLISILLLSSIYHSLYSATYTSAVTGNWDTGTTWVGGTKPPVNNNDVINISAGHTVTKTGDLLVNTNNIVFNVYGNLVITGTLDLRNNLIFNIYSGGSVTIANLSADQNASLTISGGGTATVTGDLTFGGNADVTIDGTLTVDGNITVGNNSTLGGTGTVNVGGGCSQGTGSNFCNSGPLPVDLTSFKAQEIEESVLVTWTTATELNNDYFTLEKSKNGRDFQPLAQVPGSGTTTQSQEYSFTDTHPWLGLSYYRLSQTDFDGTTEIFKAVSVVFSGSFNAMSVSPNPVRDQALTLRSVGWDKNEPLKLNIYSITGVLIGQNFLTTDYYGNIEEPLLLDKKLEKGLYLFELSGSKRKAMIKVIGE